MACLEREAGLWDRRLNGAYAAPQRRVEAGQREPLRVAQRSWVRHRDANCRFRGSRDGSIKLTDAASCLREVTDARALELTMGSE